MRFIRLNKHLQQANTAQGFTLIELLVIAPVAILAIAGLISVMVGLVGDALVARQYSATAYQTQDALNRIEQDAKITTQFSPLYDLMTSPQGRNGSTESFATSKGDLILTQFATTANPYTDTRSIVYFGNRPNACTGEYYLNQALTLKVIYFLLPDGNGSNTLWRRTIVPPWSTSSADSTYVCNRPWQRDSCPINNALGTVTCRTHDDRIADNIASMEIKYFTSEGTETTDSRLAASVSVKLNASQKTAGETATFSGTVRAKRINAVLDDIPAAPTVSVFNPDITEYNNSTKVTFGWDDVPYAAVYDVRYRVNSGTWVSVPNITKTEYAISGYMNDSIEIGVTAKNDMGESVETLASKTLPVWTNANMENTWKCSAYYWYPCPSFTMTREGMVLLRGMASSGASGTTAFTLPTNMRPHKQLLLATASAASIFSRIDISADGRVQMSSVGNNGWVSFDTIRFLASSKGATWTVIAPNSANGWKHYDTGTSAWQKLEYARDGTGRVYVQGLLDGSTTIASGTVIATLPAGTAAKGSMTGIYPTAAASNFANYNFTSTAITSRGLGAIGSWFALNSIYHDTTSLVNPLAIPLTTSPTPAWVNYGGSYATAESFLANGVVSVRGLVRSGKTTATAPYEGAVIGTLPAGRRPANRLIFLTAGRSGASEVSVRVDVYADGAIVLMNNEKPATSEWLSLEGIHFLAEQ